MSERVYFSDELLQPISDGSPSGEDLLYDPLFTQIGEARRSDDQLVKGEWQRAERPKVANWDKVADLCLGALTTRTKDLRLACFLTEAGIHLDGFSGLRDCLRLIKELIYRFWDQGLFPEIEDGDLDYRASGLTWLNDRMPEVLRQVPIIRTSRGEKYSFASYLQAVRIGSEESIARMDGETRKIIKSLREQGWITMDVFSAAIKSTKREDVEVTCGQLTEACDQLLALEKVVDERFGSAAPVFSRAKEEFEGIKKVLLPELNRKIDEEREKSPASTPKEGVSGSVPQGQASRTGVVGQFWTTGTPSAHSGSWQHAEAFVRSGRIDEGLARMAALAAQETTLRDRFLRKLTLADICLSNNRPRLARTILQELNRQIVEFKLERWESSALVGGVWSRLYRMYTKSGVESEKEDASKLYNQLCELDPWQALTSCED